MFMTDRNALMTPPECHPGQQAYTFLIRILSTSFISVSNFSVFCYSRVSISAWVLLCRVLDVCIVQQSSLTRGLLIPPVITVYTLILHQREGIDTLEYWPRMPCIIRVWWVQVLFTSGWTWHWLAAQQPLPKQPRLLQASTTKQIMPPCRKVPLQEVNFLDDDILLWCLHS